MTDFTDLPCTNCGCVTPDLVTGKKIYPHRSDLHGKPIWLCPCGAYVGCHPGTENPLGRPAEKDVRDARRYVHRVLDPLWKNAPEHYGKDMRPGKARNIARSRVYKWLADQMGLTSKQTHTGMFDINQCRQAYAILKKVDYPAIREWEKERVKQGKDAA